MPSMRHRTRNRSRSVFVRAVLGLVVAACLLGLTEIGFRLTGVEPAYAAVRMGLWQTAAAMRDRRIRGNREPHDFVVNTDEHGLRTALSLPRTPDASRVAVMGDSNVFGWGVGDDATFAAATQRALRAAGHPQAELLNAGQPGYSTAQMGWIFDKDVALFQPDLTVVFISLHDFNLTLVSDIEARDGAHGPAAMMRVFLARHSRIYEVLRHRLYPFADQVQVKPMDSVKEPRVPRVSDEERVAILDAMRTNAQRWGGEVTVGLLPDYGELLRQGKSPGVSRAGSRWAEDYAASRSLPFLDLRRCCSDRDPDALVFPYDHGHMNATGHEAIGAALAVHLSAWIGE
jgi:lysophospholipase L1-like esterase